MLPSLENFMTWGQDAFIARPDYRAMIVDIYTSAIENDHLGATDRCNASKLIEAMLLNLRGHIDDALPRIVATALKGLSDTDEPRAARLANLEVLVNAVLYNAPAALQLMGQAGLARAFFDQWFTAVRTENGLPRVHDKKLSILACCELLKLPGAAVPAELQEGWTGIVASVLTLLKELPEAITSAHGMICAATGPADTGLQSARPSRMLSRGSIAMMRRMSFRTPQKRTTMTVRGRAQAAYSVSNPSLQRATFGTRTRRTLTSSQKRCVCDSTDVMPHVLTCSQAASLRKPNGGVALDDEDDDEDDEDDEVEEELGYLSPLEPANAYISFKHALTGSSCRPSAPLILI